MWVVKVGDGILKFVLKCITGNSFVGSLCTEETTEFVSSIRFRGRGATYKTGEDCSEWSDTALV